jgi:hypothetical protein
VCRIETPLCKQITVIGNVFVRAHQQFTQAPDL